MTFESRLRFLRKSKGKTQQEVVDEMVANGYDIDRSTLSGYETGRREPNMTVIKEFASYYNVDANYLLEIDTEDGYYLNEETRRIAQEAFDNPDKQVLFDAVKNVPPDDIELALSILERMTKDGGTD